MNVIQNYGTYFVNSYFVIANLIFFTKIRTKMVFENTATELHTFFHLKA